MFLHKVRVNGINWTEGKKIVRVSEVFELSEFELSGVITNYYKKNCQILGEFDLVRVKEEFELSEFELAGDYCSAVCASVRAHQCQQQRNKYTLKAI